jgi:hypothetical protein
MTMSAGGEMTPSRKKGDNASWTDVNLTGLKNKKTTQSIQLQQMDNEYLK